MMANEDRLIRLSDIQKFPIRIDHYDKEHGNEHFVYGVETVIEYAENLPIVDAVEVVRCKDCKHRMWSEFDRCYVCHHCGFNAIEENWWCAEGAKMDGERRTDAV